MSKKYNYEASYEEVRNILVGRWLHHYEWIYRYIIPDQYQIAVLLQYDSRGYEFNRECYNETVINSSRKRANRMHGLMFPNGVKWGKIKSDNPNVKADVQNALDNINEVIFHYINHSNLSSVLENVFLSLNVGTAGIWIDHDDRTKEIIFKAIPTTSLLPVFTDSDTVEDCWFIRACGKEQILDNPIYKGADLDTLRNKTDNNIVYVKCFQRKVKNGYEFSEFLENFDKPIYQKVFSYKKLLVARNGVKAGEVYGRGVIFDNLNTSYELNKLSRNFYSSLNVEANLPLIYNPEIIDENQIRHSYRAGEGLAGLTIPDDMTGVDPIRKVNLAPTQLSIYQIITELQNTINDNFAIAPFGDVNGSVKSATEINILNNENYRNSVTDISRNVNELNKPIYEAIFTILNNWGYFDDYEDLLKNENLQYSFTSPLNQIQNQSDYQNTMQLVQSLENMGGQQFIAMTLDPIKTGQKLAQYLNVDSNILASPNQQQQMAQTVMKMQQAQQSFQQPTQNPQQTVMGANP